MISTKNNINSIDNYDFLSSGRVILVTGGAGFIGSAVIRRLLMHTSIKIFNIDKLGYASDLTSIDLALAAIGESSNNRYQFLQVDLTDFSALDEAIKYINPDLIMHLAAESHVDRSIHGPNQFIESNILGTFNLLKSTLTHYESLSIDRKKYFKFHHISTDEVFGSLGNSGLFDEYSNYEPRSPYSASKASSDHLVNAWFHTYGLPVVITNCSNNYGPWQFPEKLIPVVISKAISGNHIPIYGNGLNIRDWLYVEDHVDALILCLSKGVNGEKYCIGGNNERSNLDIVNDICEILDDILPQNYKYNSLIRFVDDRLGHDYRYAINPKKITDTLHWYPKHKFNDGLTKTVGWYVDNFEWLNRILSSNSNL